MDLLADLPSAAIDRVAVVVPARDEELAIGNCLAALAVAHEQLLERRPGLDVQVLVVLDRCTDRTGAIAAKLGIACLETSFGRVGAARRAGFEQLLAPDGDSRTWLATTDADSTVPPNWLTRQVDAAAAGADMVLGTVQPTGLPAWAAAAWRARHRFEDGHQHVFGANLGVRADVYRRCGGFTDAEDGEDVGLVRAVAEAGGLVLALGGDPVSTSGRTAGRTPGGFAGYLRWLLAAVPPDAAETVA